MSYKKSKSLMATVDTDCIRSGYGKNIHNVSKETLMQSIPEEYKSFADKIHHVDTWINESNIRVQGYISYEDILDLTNDPAHMKVWIKLFLDDCPDILWNAGPSSMQIWCWAIDF